MPKRDARKLDHKTLEEIRTRAVEQVQAGESPEVVIQTLGFSRACIYNWLARYRAGGWGGLKAKPLAGRPKKISGAQLRWLYGTVVGKNPLQFRFEFALWTRWMIQILLRKQFWPEAEPEQRRAEMDDTPIDSLCFLEDCLKFSRANRAFERGVVLLILVGVGNGERSQ